MALTDAEARYAAKRLTDYKLADGEGLHLLIRPNGSKLWRLKYRFAGKEKLLSFGAYPDVSLGEARLKRAEASRDRLRLFICCHELHRLLLWDGIGHFRADGIERARIKARVHILDVPVGLVRENNATYLPLSPRDESQARDPNPHLVGLLDKGRRALDDVFANREVAVADLARRRGVSPHRYARLVKLNYLAPDIVAAILDGQQPPDLTVHKLIRTSVPLDWAVQRQMLGFRPRHDVGGSLIRYHDWRRWDAAYGHGSRQAGPDKPLFPSDEAADGGGAS